MKHLIFERQQTMFLKIDEAKDPGGEQLFFDICLK